MSMTNVGVSREDMRRANTREATSVVFSPVQMSLPFDAPPLDQFPFSFVSPRRLEHLPIVRQELSETVSSSEKPTGTKLNISLGGDLEVNALSTPCAPLVKHVDCAHSLGECLSDCYKI